VNASALLKERVFGLAASEATFAKRGFKQVNPKLQNHLESVGKSFIVGYNTALRIADPTALADELNHIASRQRGFAFEGAAMALALLDRLTFSANNRFNALLEGAGSRHKYMLHVGAGWAMARLPWGFKQHLQSLDPLLRWLALDGYGFHEGYFHWQHSIDRHKQPQRLRDYELQAFDQGLGRSLWFVKGAQIQAIINTIGSFPYSRHPNLWSGIGLASTYAGGVDQDDLLELKKQAGPHLASLAQGSAFAAKARVLANTPAANTDLACSIFLGMPTEQAAAICDQAELNLPVDEDLPAYEIWRQRIQSIILHKEVA
jgi:hypothetical protein